MVGGSSIAREMQSLLLQQAGCTVALFDQPHAALATAARQPFDLAVFDCALPEMTGEQFIRELQALRPGLGIILVADALTLELVVDLTRQGVAAIFQKSAPPAALLDKVNDLLQRATREALRPGSRPPLEVAVRPVAASGPHTSSSENASCGGRHLVGASAAFHAFSQRLWLLRDFRTVLLLRGHTGDPFEEVARELVETSAYRGGPTIACPAIAFQPDSLIEKLAPTLLSADSGTLVVLGVEEFDEEQQRTLEHLLEGRGVFLPFARRFRVVLAATDRLAARVADGSFDEALFERIGALALDLPARCEWRATICESSCCPTGLARETTASLEAHDSPSDCAGLFRGETAHAGSCANRVAPRDSTMPWCIDHRHALARPPLASGRVAVTRSLFRPASRAYNFGKRLSESLALAAAS
jgi:DNA-binding NtrC family response regulator